MSAVVRSPNLLAPTAGFLALFGYAASMIGVVIVLLIRRDA
jgi:biotin transporter BioY